MTPFHPVEIHEVSEKMFDNLLEHLSYYDIGFTSQGGRRYQAAGRGVRGDIEYDPVRQAVRMTLQDHHSLVTAGYLIGFFYDRLVAGLPADSEA